jgi:hypothetical protein
MQYMFNQTPENNGFTREFYRDPPLTVVNQITGGNPAERRVEIDSRGGGGCVFFTSSVPSLDASVGVTAEVDVSVEGVGDAGFELTFLDYAILLNIYEESIDVNCPGYGNVVSTDPNTAITKFRLLFKPSHEIEIYRQGVLILGPDLLPSIVKPFQRVLWWGEGNSLATFKGLKYWSGGAMPPG